MSHFVIKSWIVHPAAVMAVADAKSKHAQFLEETIVKGSHFNTGFMNQWHKNYIAYLEDLVHASIMSKDFIAVTFHNTQQLRERIAYVIVPLLRESKLPTKDDFDKWFTS